MPIPTVSRPAAARRLAALAALLAFAAPARAAAPAAPWAGVWEGAAVRGDRRQPAGLVLRPRGAGGAAGMLYVDGAEFGALEDARLTADSLTFHLANLACVAGRAGDRLTLLLLVPHGSTHRLDLVHVSADTTRLPASVASDSAAAAPVMAGAALPPAPDSAFLAHAVAPDSVSSVAACVQRGTLFLVGGGPGQDDLYARFVQLAGGTAANLVEIPTATPVLPGRPGPRDGSGLAARFGVAHVSVVDARSRAQADSAAFTRPLAAATGVWLDGGEGMNLLNAYLGTRTERALVDVLARGGVVAGTSAGALVWGSRTILYHSHPGARAYELPRAEDVYLGSPRAVGFGLLRNVLVVPHFTEQGVEPALRRVLGASPGLLAIGIDEATALEVHGDVGTVRGRGHVTVFDGRAGAAAPGRVLAAGARYDLRRRVVL